MIYVKMQIDMDFMEKCWEVDLNKNQENDPSTLSQLHVDSWNCLNSKLSLYFRLKPQVCPNHIIDLSLWLITKMSLDTTTHHHPPPSPNLFKGFEFSLESQIRYLSLSMAQELINPLPLTSTLIYPISRRGERKDLYDTFPKFCSQIYQSDILT